MPPRQHQDRPCLQQVLHTGRSQKPAHRIPANRRTQADWDNLPIPRKPKKPNTEIIVAASVPEPAAIADDPISDDGMDATFSPIADLLDPDPVSDDDRKPAAKPAAKMGN